METKKSIVKSAIFKKANSGANGLYYIHDIVFENGDTGVYFSKTEAQDVFKQGVETDYTIEEKKNGQYTNYSIKPLKSAGGFIPGKAANPLHEHKRTALKCAVDLVCHGKIEEKQLLPSAEKFMKFLNE